MIFVFGSNLRGIHGAGAALYAKQNKGAIQGRAWGLQGNSFAIPTKETPWETLPLMKIESFVKQFLLFAGKTPFLGFEVTNIGCGLAGYTPEQIAPMFKGHPPNVYLSEEFKKVISDENNI